MSGTSHSLVRSVPGSICQAPFVRLLLVSNIQSGWLEGQDNCMNGLVIEYESTGTMLRLSS